MTEQQSPGKPFEISKMEVRWAWEKVRDNKGAAGIDGQSIADFEQNVQNNLYKIWNRKSSGSRFPPPVKAVEIPKPGGTRSGISIRSSSARRRSEQMLARAQVPPAPVSGPWPRAQADRPQPAGPPGQNQNSHTRRNYNFGKPCSIAA